MNKELKGIIFKLLIVIVVILFFVFIGKIIFNHTKTGEEISGIMKILAPKYNNIECLDDLCNGFTVIDEDDTILYSKSMKKLTTLEKNLSKIIAIKDDYYITSDNVVKNYDNEVIYESNNKLSSINEDLILEEKNLKYSIININGKILYKNISNVDTYYNNEYIVINKKTILDKKGIKLLDNYNIVEILKNEYEDEVGFIINNIKDDTYNYYSISQNEIIGNSFISYTYDNNYIIADKNNNQYILKPNGKTVKYSDELNQKLVNEVENENNIIINNTENEEVINISKDSYFELSYNNYIYKNSNYIKIYNINNDKTYEYELKENESIYGKPFRKTIFIYNDTEKYLKLINFKGNLIDDLKDIELVDIKYNKYNKNAYIIVKRDNRYGIYIAR